MVVFLFFLFLLGLLGGLEDVENKVVFIFGLLVKILLGIF